MRKGKGKKVTKVNPVNNEYYEQFEKYDDYYDNFSREREKTSVATIVSVVSMMVIILALVIVGLALLKPREEHIDLVQADTIENNEEAAQTVLEDSDPPVIYGVMPLVTYAGHSVSYKESVYVTDDTDPSPVLEIENDDVDLSTPGSYVVAYVARDKDQNVTREYTTLTVIDGENIISEEDIMAFADTVLDALITDEMSDIEKCLKVYEYLHAIGYVDKVHSEDWMQNAYWMMKKREGDCFCYYSAARLLLTRLGYDVMEVRNNNNYVHYWCLVSIDKGNTWWHFDACCWSWGEDGILCLVSDNYLTTFTKRHMTSDGRLIHAWDRTNYPATPVEDFWTDEDRAVIYESGLIELKPEYDPNDDIWNYSNGWDDYYSRFGNEYYNGYNDYYYDPGYYSTENYVPEDDYTGETGDTPEYSEDTGYVTGAEENTGNNDPGYSETVFEEEYYEPVYEGVVEGEFYEEENF